MRYLAVGLLLVCSTALQAGDKPFVRVRWKDTTVYISYQGKALEYNFGDAAAEQNQNKPYTSLFLADIDTLKTMYLGEEDGSVYMLLNISGPSRGAAGASGMCGAGTESALVLFMFDREGELEEPSVVRYDSCFATIELKAGQDDSPHVDEETGKIVTTFLYYRQLKKYDMRKPPPEDAMGEVTVHAAFDPRQPKLGFAIEETCVISNSSSACPAAQ